jgi:hypothetical protein
MTRYRATQYGQNDAAGQALRAIDFKAGSNDEALRKARERLSGAAVVGVRALR